MLTNAQLAEAVFSAVDAERATDAGLTLAQLRRRDDEQSVRITLAAARQLDAAGLTEQALAGTPEQGLHRLHSLLTAWSARYGGDSDVIAAAEHLRTASRRIGGPS